MSILIRNVRLFETKPPYTVTEGQDVYIEKSEIKKIGVNLDVKADSIIDGSGKTLIPGNVCAHHHYYSGLSRGMLIDSNPQRDFIEVLREWWWRLDRALDEESTYYSSLICSLDAIKAGTTSVVDHHASPSFIDGSLSVIAKGMREVGIRGVTCYEVTDRNRGMDEIRDGVRENIRFAKEVDEELKEKKDVLVEAMIGAHAPFTIPDEGMVMLKGAEEETGRGLHIHIAEDKYDQVYSHHRYAKDIVERLDDFDLLNERSLLVHGLYLYDSEIELLNERKCFFAHNPRSNMNNHVGYNRHLRDIDKLVLGTDGCGGNMFEEIKIAFFKHKDDGGAMWPADFLKILNRGNALVESAFSSRFKLGRIKEGYKADLVLLDYDAPTPLVKKNAATHFVWGISSNSVDTVIINGKTVLKDKKFCDIDADEIYAKSRECAKRLWKKADRIK